MRLLRVIAFALCLALQIASAVGEKGTKHYAVGFRVAFVDVDRLLQTHPVRDALMNSLGELRRSLLHRQIKQQTEARAKQRFDLERTPIYPTEMPEPIEPALEALPEEDIGVIERSCERLKTVVEELRNDAEGQLPLLLDAKRAEIRKQYLLELQNLLELQSPVRTRISIRLLSPSLSASEREAILSEETKLDAELESKVGEAKRKAEEQLFEYERSLREELLEHFKRMDSDLERCFLDALRTLVRERIPPRWLDVRELWHTFSPQVETQFSMKAVEQKLLDNLERMEERLDLEGFVEGVECEFVSGWEKALRESIIRFANAYALQHGFKKLVTKRQPGVVDITEDVARELRKAMHIRSW